MLENRLRNIHLRRIWWAVDSPSFLDLPQSVDYFQDAAHRSEVMAILLEEEGQTEAVDHYFEAFKVLAMGRYFEQLLIFILERDKRYELLDSNLQVIEEKVTKGELDLILFDYKHQVKRHWEIALKFYLQVGDNGHHDNFLGPSTHDYLARKMKKLYQSQLPLGQHPQIAQKHGPLVSGVFLKGQLFYPSHRKVVLPDKAQKKSPAYSYMDLSQFEAWQQEGENRFALLKKPHWISPYLEEDGIQLLNKFDILKVLAEEIERIDRPQLLAICRKTDEAYAEMQRIFVCPLRWPHKL